jgi:hypothetical protein
MEHPIIINSRGKTVTRVDFKSRLISKYISTAAGRSALAAAMAAPIRRQLNYSGLARKVFQVTPLPAGAISTYDKADETDDVAASPDDQISFKHDSVVINSHGKTGKKVWSAGRVVIPSFEIYQNPTIRLGDIKARRFNLIDRVQPTVFKNNLVVISSRGKTTKRRRRFSVIDRAVQRARAEIMAQEDSMIFQALDNLGVANGSSNDQ